MNSSNNGSEPVPQPSGLQEELKDLLIKSVMIRFEGKPQDHPVVIINCLKNLISDDRDSNHSKLLNKMREWLYQFPEVENPDTLISEVRKTATGEPIFVSDLAEAVQHGKKDEAVDLGARLHLSALSPTLIQESMTEIFLQEPDVYGQFCYHWLRANHFIASDKLIWPVSYAGFQFVGIKKLPGPAYPSDLPNFQILIKELSQKNDYNNLFIISSLVRILGHEYVRTPKFSNEVSYWMHMKMQELESPAEHYSNVQGHKIESDFYLKTLYSNLNNVKELPSLIKGLEAFRALIKTADSSTRPYVVEALNRWITK